MPSEAQATSEDPATIERRLADGWTRDRDRRIIRRSDGIVVRADFIGPVDERLFAVSHLPARAPRAGVVVCPPLYAEAIRNQRRELVAGWELSAAGFAVQRFHYRGSGHSDGETSSLVLERLVDDARRVARHLQEAASVEQLAFVGTRIGATVAALAAADFPDAPLVLWAPIVDMDAYLTELRRARMIGLLREGRQADAKSTDHFGANGHIDVVGYPVSQRLYESVAAAPLEEAVRSAGPRTVLALQMTRRQEVRPDLAAVVERWNAAGLRATAGVVPYDEAWWFGAAGSSVIELSAGGLDVVPATVAAFQDQLS